MHQLKISTLKQEGLFHASKWLKHQVLLDIDEMKELVQQLPLFAFYNISEVVTSFQIERSRFLEVYKAYLDHLKKGMAIEDKIFRKMFSSVMSVSGKELYAMKVKEGAYLIKLLKPCVQLQQHSFLFSPIDGKIHPMVLSQQSISWGIQFSYPQIFQYPHPQEKESFVRVRSSQEFLNNPLYNALVKWIRESTVPTTFICEGKKIGTPLRIGRQCFSWIDSHPQLMLKNIEVEKWQSKL